ncbi:MAG TPA: anthranilate phosphoribosyltransferase [Chlamydiales bacterium]|nr:anthranilate phosphoribosyltransferase [Chlamydiales bacterium]
MKCKAALHSLIQGESLSAAESCEAVSEYIHDPVQMGAFLVLLKAKGETVEEILGLVRAMRAQMKALHLDRPVLDIVGTGGDQAGTVNISTGSALLAARCGIPVVKHGNRAVSSQCGSADVLEAMGYDIHADAQESLRRTGFAFCFAPDYHPAMKQVRPVRNALGMATAFNLIGPLLNPAGTDYMQIGVYKPELVQILAEVLFQLGTKRSLVYCGQGMDELSCIGPTEAILVTEQGLEPLYIDPEQLGLKKCTLEDLQGGDAKRNAELLRKPTTAIRDTLILNAGVALFLYGPARSLEEGVQIAKRKCRRSLKEAIQQRPCAVIAEVKRASPSKGKIGEIADVGERAKMYEAGGACAISVLTSERFEGNLADLKGVSVSIPVLRKDFLTTKEQLAETDADVVLLIVAYLGKRTKEMLQEARALGFEAIVEVHSEAELQIALQAGAEIIGVNQRNLKDFSMHPRIHEIVRQIPKHIVKIAESGVGSISDAERLFAMGYDALLVGEALTRNPQLCEALCSLKFVG